MSNFRSMTSEENMMAVQALELQKRTKRDLAVATAFMRTLCAGDVTTIPRIHQNVADFEKISRPELTESISRLRAVGFLVTDKGQYNLNWQSDAAVASIMSYRQSVGLPALPWLTRRTYDVKIIAYESLPHAWCRVQFECISGPFAEQRITFEESSAELATALHRAGETEICVGQQLRLEISGKLTDGKYVKAYHPPTTY